MPRLSDLARRLFTRSLVRRPKTIATRTASRFRPGVENLEVRDVPAMLPMPMDDDATTRPGQPVWVDVLSNDSDDDGSLQLVGVGQPGGGAGAAAVVGSQVLFTPSPTFSGDVTFSYAVDDGVDGGATASVTVHVTNTAPSAMDDWASTHNAAVAVDVLTNDMDMDGDGMALSGWTQPAHGTVTAGGSGGALVYTPAAGYAGGDAFQYTVADGYGGVVTGWVTIDVTNSSPWVSDISVTTHNGPVTVDVLANAYDMDGDALTLAGIVSGPAHGALSVQGGLVTYTPAAGYAGGDGFAYAVTDGYGGAEVGWWVSIEVMNNSPMAEGDWVSTHGGVVTVAVLANDTDMDGDGLTLSAWTQPQHGTVTAGEYPGTLRYTPPDGYAGAQTFEYTVRDGYGGVSTATVTVDVINSTPSVTDDVASMHNGWVAVDVLANDMDMDGDGMVVSSWTQPDKGTVTAGESGGTLVYTPPAGYFGTQRFWYTVKDTFGSTSTGMVTVTVTNEAPTAEDDYVYIRGGSVTVAVLANDRDMDGDVLFVERAGGGVGQPVVRSDGTITWTPPAGHTGGTQFQYTVSDIYGGTATGTVTIVVSNSAPLAGNDEASAAQGEPITINVLENDSDMEYDALTVTAVSGGVGRVAINPDGTLKYTPKAGFTGDDRFTYTVRDEYYWTTTATVTVTVTAAAAKPSNLLVRADQAAEWTRRLSTPGKEVTTAPYLPGSDYVRLVIPNEDRNPADHDRIAGVLGASGLTGPREAERQDALRAIYRGDVDFPPGYGDRFLVFNLPDATPNPNSNASAVFAEPVAAAVPSSLVVRADQAAEWIKRLSVPGARVTLAKYKEGSDYVRLVLPDSQRTNEAHARIKGVFEQAGLNGEPGPLGEVLGALYRGGITAPPGYDDRYAVFDPDSGLAYLSWTADFGASQLSGDMSKLSPERLKQMVKDKVAQEVGGYIYVAWVDVPNGSSTQLVYEPFRTVTGSVTTIGDNGESISAGPREISALNLPAAAGDYYKPVLRFNPPLGTTSPADVFAGITTKEAAENAVAAVSARKEGRALDASLARATIALEGLKIAARITPVLGTVISATEGDVTEAIISGVGDATMIFGFGVALKAIQAGRVVRYGLVASAAFDGTVAVYRGAQGVDAALSENYPVAIAKFADAALRLVGVTVNLHAYFKAAGQAKALAAQAEATLAEIAPDAAGAAARGGFNPRTATVQEYTDEIGRKVQSINPARPNDPGMNCADCAINTDILLRTGTATPAATRATSVAPGDLARIYRSQFNSFGIDIAAVKKVMASLPEGSTGIVFLSRGEQPGHFINVVKKGGEVQFWCGQSAWRGTNPIERFSFPGLEVVSVDLMITSRGVGPVVLNGSLP